jgi:hypothetical protein
MFNLNRIKMTTKQFFIVAVLLLQIHAYSQTHWIGTVNATSPINRSGIVSLSGTSYTQAKFNIQGTTNWTHLMHGTNEDIYLRPGKDLGNIIMDKGKVAVGTMSPQANFHIYGATRPNFKLQNSISYLEVAVTNNYSDFNPFASEGDVVFRTGSSKPYHRMVFSLNDDNQDGNSYIKFADNAKVIMAIYNNFIVRVNGKLIASELEVKTDIWSDFVFDPNYNLITLNDLEKYITEQKHLPGVPTQAEVLEKGVNVGEMNAILLQKIEELTLYLIEQDKKIELQNERIQQLEAKINELNTDQ